MTGSWHYRQAELHAEDANSFELEGERVKSCWHQRQGQLHATLALAAATAPGSRGCGSGHDGPGGEVL